VEADQCFIYGCNVTSGCTKVLKNCEDGDPCTLDFCDPDFGCLRVLIDCDDHNPCTIDSCVGNGNCSHIPFTCVDHDNDPCTAPLCLGNSGNCTEVPFNCTSTNPCVVSQCMGNGTCNVTAYSCDDSDPCTVDTCLGNFLCSNIAYSCDDHNPCTVDTCLGNLHNCSHIPFVCSGGNACTQHICLGNGSCTYPPVNIGDGDFCTNDACNINTGEITHTPVVCVHDACHTAHCEHDFGCQYAPISCHDDDMCTDLSCDPQTGCTFAPVICFDGNSCTNDTCDPETGCPFSNVTCDDNDMCTQNLCNASVGCYYPPIPCVPPNACTDAVCHPDSGCQFSVHSCDDHSVCTVDSCDPVTGCDNDPIDCSDTNPCTVDSCDNVTGCSNILYSCDDGIPCTVDSCNGDGTCTHVSHGCNDGNPCTIDICDGFGGCNHTLYSCDDHNPCTVDACDGLGGCINTAYDCDDHNLCTNDTCNGVGGCTNVAPDCDDNDICTLDSCDEVTGDCVHESRCDDDDVCTNNVCNPITGACTFAFRCDDHDPCTDDFCNPITGACTHLPKNCSDANLCTIDTCVPGNGTCLHTPKICDSGGWCEPQSCDLQTGLCMPDNPRCVDGNICTDDICDPVAQQCHFPPTNCSDGNPCTVDFCDPSVGCRHIPVGCDPCVNNDDCAALDDLNPLGGVACGECVAGFCTTYNPCDDHDPCTIDVPSVETWFNPLPGGGVLPYQVFICRRFANMNISECQDPHPCMITAYHWTPIVTACGRPVPPGTIIVGQGENVELDITCPPNDDFCFSDFFCTGNWSTCTPDTLPECICKRTKFDNCCHNDSECQASDACHVTVCDPQAHVCVPQLLRDCAMETCIRSEGMGRCAAVCVIPQYDDCDSFFDIYIEISYGLPPRSPCASDPRVAACMACLNEDDFLEDCEAYAPCHNISCLLPSGECEFVETLCIDHDLCHINERCVMVNDTPTCLFDLKNCSDNNRRSIDGCNSLTGECTHFFPHCVECECHECNDHNPCTLDSCNHTNGCCRHDPVHCNEDDKCSLSVCDVFGGCQVVWHKDCNDDNPCTVESCDPATGSCITNPKPCGTELQIVGDACEWPVCDPHTGQCMIEHLDVDDHNPCTVDTCDTETGAVHTKIDCPIDVTRPCLIPICLDYSGGCAFQPLDCDDHNPCTDDTCQTPGGTCGHTQKNCGCDSRGRLISDPCMACGCSADAGGCFVRPISCDDHNPCTTDACISSTGACVHAELDCGCSPAGTVVDNVCLFCTCSVDAGGCKTYERNCDDKDPTTRDWCEHPAGCRHARRACPDDGNLCTEEVLDPKTGQCLHIPIKCEDSNECTIDSCNTTTGHCVHARKEECFGNNRCMTYGCDAATGICTTPVTKDCDDMNPCTQDNCDPLTGLCAHIPIPLPSSGGSGNAFSDTPNMPVINLRSAANYVILSKTGISTTGTTLVVGNIGVSPLAPGGITGFGLVMDPSNQFATSSLLVGKAYAADYAPPTPAILTTAVSDMETAYTEAAGRPAPDFIELGSGEIGGMTLVPGLYKWSTGLSISTNVTLSGGINAVWIFQIAQTLTVASGVHVYLIGGAQAGNVFWQVAGTVALGTTSAFNGIILAKVEITMADGATLSGRALSQTAVTLIGDGVAVPIPTVPIPGGDGLPPCSTYKCDVNHGGLYIDTLDCRDGNACTVDFCDPVQNECVHVPRFQCETDLPCHESRCNSNLGRCEVVPLPIDDNNPCTVDACVISNATEAGWEIVHVQKCPRMDASNLCFKFRGCDRLTGDCIDIPVDCDDRNPCTDDVCNQFHGCLHHPVSCDDSDDCTSDWCSKDQGGCRHAPVTCDDNDPTTVDTCHQNPDHPGIPLCTHEYLPCDDGIKCTIDELDDKTGECHHYPKNCERHSKDKCIISECSEDLGICVSSRKKCPQPEDLCYHSECDRSTGECSEPVAISCDDRNLCTADVCHSATGECVHEAVNCDDQDPCTVDSCSHETGACLHEQVDCGDGNPCTADVCISSLGECTHVPRFDCTSEDMCTIGTCNINTGQCVYTNVDCDDKNWCTVDFCDGETGDCKNVPKICPKQPCMIESCVPTTGDCVYDPVDCEDGDPRTIDWCDPTIRVYDHHHHHDDNSSPSLDEESVTDMDNHHHHHRPQPPPDVDGVCRHKLNECHRKFYNNEPRSGDGEWNGFLRNSCVDYVLNKLTGQCMRVEKNCDDNNPCTTDTCRIIDGECLHTEKDCDDGVNCTVDSCDRGTGECRHIPKQCDDSDLCTMDYCIEASGECGHAPELCGASAPGLNPAPGNWGHCVLNECYPGDGGCYTVPLSCDDQNACTNDTCVEGIGCIHTHKDCSDTVDDNPNYLCTLNRCHADTGECFNPPINCDDGLPWTIDWCNPDTGKCEHLDNVCDNPDPCIVNKTSKSDGRCHATPIDCRDGDACTTDTCVRGECVHAKLDCDDENACTLDFCNRHTGFCAHRDVDCQGFDKCMIYGCDNETGCFANRVICDDNDLCTVDFCNPHNGECVFRPIHGIDDHNPCTIDSCIDGVIFHIPVECDDHNPCTIDTCNTRNGQCIFADRECLPLGPCFYAQCEECDKHEHEHEHDHDYEPRGQEHKPNHDKEHHKHHDDDDDEEEKDRHHHDHDDHHDKDDHREKEHCFPEVHNSTGEDPHALRYKCVQYKISYEDEETDCSRAYCDPETGNKVVITEKDGTPCNLQYRCKSFSCYSGECRYLGKRVCTTEDLEFDERLDCGKPGHEKCRPHHGTDHDHDHDHDHPDNNNDDDHHTTPSWLIFVVVFAVLAGLLILVGIGAALYSYREEILLAIYPAAQRAY